jgi:hypothetical protein
MSVAVCTNCSMQTQNNPPHREPQGRHRSRARQGAGGAQPAGPLHRGQPRRRWPRRRTAVAAAVARGRARAVAALRGPHGGGGAGGRGRRAAVARERRRRADRRPAAGAGRERGGPPVLVSCSSTVRLGDLELTNFTAAFLNPNTNSSSCQSFRSSRQRRARSRPPAAAARRQPWRQRPPQRPSLWRRRACRWPRGRPTPF